MHQASWLLEPGEATGPGTSGHLYQPRPVGEGVGGRKVPAVRLAVSTTNPSRTMSAAQLL